jgi:glucokinase
MNRKDRGHSPLLLAGDVGGTKTDLAVISSEDGPRAPLAQARYASEEFGSLDAMVTEFMTGTGFHVAYACFGVAGPVVRGRAHLMNLPWIIEEQVLAAALNVKTVRLLNDLDAIARAVPALQPGDLHTLNIGERVAGGAIAVVAPGTGLGEAYSTWTGSGYRAHPSEGGHAGFAPADPTQIGLLRYLQQQLDHVSVERACSGIGIPNIYAYFRDSGHAIEPPDVAAELAAAPDRTRSIIEKALDPRGRSDLCRVTLDTFVSILGAEAGNLALKVLTTGGLYLAGGIPAHILSALGSGRFMEAFTRKGRLADLLARVPVHVVVNPRVALLGAAGYGLALIQSSWGRDSGAV